MDSFEDNPFADPAQINPFADPSVAAATEPPPSTEEYNPFAQQEESKEPEVPRIPPPASKTKDTKKQKEKKPKPSGPQRPPAQSQEPAILPTGPPPPSYEPAPTQFPGQSPADVSELEKREAEVARREATLKEREKNLATLGTDARPRNFPPLPKFCPCQPCFYINISEEIPPGERSKMRLVVVALFAYTALLLLNLILATPGAYYTTARSDDTDLTVTSGILGIIFGAVFLVLDPVLALLCWFMPLYYAYRKDSALAFMWFFFMMVMQCIVWLLFALGPPGFSCGIISGAIIFGASNVVGAMWIIFGFLWLGLVALGALMIFLVHRYYRSSGHTLQAAGTEAAKVAASNKAVRSAVKETVKTGVSTALAAQSDE